MAELDQLNVATTRYIRSTPKLVDTFFHRDAFAAMLKKGLRIGFPGGRLIGENFLYADLPGGSYAKGAEFNITEKQVEQQIQFDPKFFYVNVTLSKEDVQVLNKGPQAIFRLLDSRMNAAYMTLGGHFAIAVYLNGIRAGFTTIINGLAEALNDNSTASWDNNTYSAYGGITRGGAVGQALNSVPTNLNGPMEYNKLEESYGDVSFGGPDEEPNLGVTTALGYSFIKEQFQPQQRFETQAPEIGFNGLKFNNATITRSRYVPGKAISTANTTPNTLAVNYLTESSAGAVTAYPTLAVANSETLFWINARPEYIHLYVTDDPEYSLGFSGFKPAQGNSKVAGQVKLACALVVSSPRYHGQVYGITG